MAVVSLWLTDSPNTGSRSKDTPGTKPTVLDATGINILRWEKKRVKSHRIMYFLHCTIIFKHFFIVNKWLATSQVLVSLSILNLKQILVYYLPVQKL